MTSRTYHASWEEQYRKLEAAFGDLPIRRGTGDDPISYENLIPYIPRELLLMRGNSPPETLPPKEGLRRVEKATRKLIDVLGQLHPSVIDALNYQGPDLHKLKLRLFLLEGAAKTAKVTDSRRAPMKVQPRKIARFVAEQYELLTGKAPTVSFYGADRGPFIILLRSVYAILGVNASAASQARAVISERKIAKAKR